MAIQYDEIKQIFTIHTKNTSYQMRIDEYGVLQHLYYGGRICGNTDYLIQYLDRGCGGSIGDTGSDRSYTLDSIPREYPTIGTGDFRSNALSILNADGSECVDLRYICHTIQKGKYMLRGLPAAYADESEASTLSVCLEDRVTDIRVELLYGVLENVDIITRSARIMNCGCKGVVLEKVSSVCLDFLYGNYDLISFHGTPAMEREYQRSSIGYGNFSIGSRRGVSSHQYNPAVIVAEQGATEDEGSCYGVMFVYSGSFLLEAEKTQFGQTRILMGLQNERFHYPLGVGETFVVPETMMTYSEHGFAEISHHFHQAIMKHVCRGSYVKAARPVLINSWEATYMDFTGDSIYKLAQEAADLGIDMVVLDDGWFGYRDDDNTSLGDWQVNEKKLGCSLGELIQRINSLGIRFGLWFEPEMISEDSNLYRQHPDWVLRTPGRIPVRSRNQLVLDFSRREIRNYIFEQMCAVLDQGNIEYIKWDMNRSLEDIWSQETAAGRIMHDYVLGVYEFLERLIQKYPYILIESCASGGGRYDAGMLYYTPQIWCSDNTDAVDRVKIQYGTSFFYPIATNGSHVSAVPNHQTGRNTSLHTRGVVAMSGTFGYELNPETLSCDEKEEVRKQVKTYKQHTDLIRNGKYYRLSSPYSDECVAWQFVSEDKKETLVNVVMMDCHGYRDTYYIRLKGLDATEIYTDTIHQIRYSGDVLMKAGLPLPEMKGNHRAYQMYLKNQKE